MDHHRSSYLTSQPSTSGRSPSRNNQPGEDRPNRASTTAPKLPSNPPALLHVRKWLSYSARDRHYGPPPSTAPFGNYEYEASVWTQEVTNGGAVSSTGPASRSAPSFLSTSLTTKLDTLKRTIDQSDQHQLPLKQRRLHRQKYSAVQAPAQRNNTQQNPAENKVITETKKVQRIEELLELSILSAGLKPIADNIGGFSGQQQQQPQKNEPVPPGPKVPFPRFPVPASCSLTVKRNCIVHVDSPEPTPYWQPRWQSSSD